MELLYGIYVYLVVINIYTFILMGLDKRYAKRKKRRVPERRFFVLGAAGGAIGVWYGMKMWRHKTQHRNFTTGIPYLAAFNIIAIIVITGLYNMNS
ncbi:DUF1294 domain-containing protein [Paenibacillus soyae]|uniref:DUF1294 domain-containing protein n=1 Tax=Paenibacillus soyae TaxID=2969249 RepID=A0A9X2S9Y0_9BACL|nr:DUF1294 domain-containing protein [Paenibacillus soyae]MCR2805535.1 DUF1294 domain-containing protein [Paenibacillus soyae]